MAENDDDVSPEDEPETPPLDFEQLLLEASRVSPGDRLAVSKILRKAVGCTRGQSAQLYDVLCEAAEMEKSTLISMHHDEKSSFGGRILRNTSDVAKALADYFRRMVPGGYFCYSLGSFQEYDPEVAPFHYEVAISDVAAAIEKPLRYNPVVQTAAALQEVIRKLAREVTEPDLFSAAPAGFNMGNGFAHFDQETGEVVLMEHGPEHRARHVLPADYDPDAACLVFQKGLERIMPDAESRNALQEALGCAALGLTLQGDNSCRMILIKGPPNCGKSTLGHIVGMFYPKALTTSLQPGDMGEKFMLPELAGKKLNLVYELDASRELGGAKFKAVLSRELVTVRRIRQEPFSFVPDAWHLCMTNDLPRLNDPTNAYDRRMRMFECPSALTREQTIPNYLEHAAAELPGIANWMIEGARRAVLRGYLAKPPEQHAMMGRMRGGTDVIMSYVSNHVVPVDRACPPVTNQRLFDGVREYAAALGVDLSDLSDAGLGRQVAKALRVIHNIVQEPTKGHGGRPQYRGVKILPMIGSQSAMPTVSLTLEGL